MRSPASMRPPEATAPLARAEAAARHPGVQAAALVAASLACYWNVLHGPFVFDDESWITENEAIGGWSAAPWEPLLRRVAVLSLRLNYLLGGLDPFGYHLFNVAVHALAAVAVYALARRLLAVATGADARGADVAWPAFGAALVFAVHPLQTQAVSYVIQRMASLAALFYVAALALYAEARAGGGSPARRRAAYVAALLAAGLATFTKETAFTLPVAVALLEASLLEGPRRRRLGAVAPFLALLPVIPALVLRGATGGVAAATRARALDVEAPPRLDYLLTQPKVVVSYLELLFVPVGQVLDHDVAVEHRLASAGVVLPALLLAALLAGGVALLLRSRGAARLAGFGIVLFFLAASVESSVVPIPDVMNEHRVYLPAAGAALALAAGLHLAARRRPERARALAAALGAWTLVLGVATVRRNEVWQDGLALWRDVVEKSPRLARGHFNLGNALHGAGDLDGATAAWRRAVALDPELSAGWNQLGNAALLRGDLVEAEGLYRGALQGGKASPDVLYNLGLVLERTGREAEALEYLREFVRAAGPERRAEAEAVRARLPGAAPSTTR